MSFQIFIMKKVLVFVLFSLILFIGSLYIFIPNTIKISAFVGVKATRNGIYRTLSDEKKIAKFWPGNISNGSFYFNNFLYTINKNDLTVLPISIKNNSTNLTSLLFLSSLDIDSTSLQWNAEMKASNNPYHRFRSYLTARKIKINMTVILQQIKSFCSEKKNIYGFDIKCELVKDSFLISTSNKSNGFPTNQFIYNLIGKLKEYANINNAKQSGFPMLNIEKMDSGYFYVKVALPTDKILTASSDIFPKRMLGRGNILVTETKGGMSIASKAMEQILKYGDDYQRSSPAIPFYSLVSDRLVETDSSKWITKIYFPVM
jgi:hypothetical protein